MSDEPSAYDSTGAGSADPVNRLYEIDAYLTSVRMDLDHGGDLPDDLAHRLVEHMQALTRILVGTLPIVGELLHSQERLLEIVEGLATDPASRPEQSS